VGYVKCVFDLLHHSPELVRDFFISSGYFIPFFKSHLKTVIRLFIFLFIISFVMKNIEKPINEV